MTAKRITGFLLLSLAAFGSYYLSQSLSETEPEDPPPPTLQSGFYLRDARILGTGMDGRPLYEVEAEYAEQRGDQTIELQTVRVIYTTEAGVPWHLVANSALISNDQEMLILSGDVIATASQGLDGQNTQIRTPYLELEPSNYVARTDDRVEVLIGTRSLNATGMLASLKDNRVSLRSNVSGKFVP